MAFHQKSTPWGARWGRPIVAFGAALGVLSASSAPAQDAGSGPVGECTPGLAPHECPERCPSYDTCYIASSAELYYQVGDQRFACDGLDCDAASRVLGDYCCERGQFAPESDESGGGGGGCTLAVTERSRDEVAGAAGLALAVVLGAARCRRPRRLARAGT